MKKIADILFIAVILTIITSGLVVTLLGNKQINQYENRYAYKVNAPTVKGYMDGSFQNSVELALSDNVLLAEYMKKGYNEMESAFMRAVLNNFGFNKAEKYIKIGDKNLYGDNYVVYNTSVFEWLEGAINKRSDMYNKLYKNHPETDFYFYYIEKDTDINFETGEKVGVFESLYEKVNFPKENMAAFKVNSFDEFKEYFYKTDHHWNHKGSYKGYKEVIDLLLVADKPIEHSEEVKLSDSFSGSKAVGETVNYSEGFWAYKYTYPTMKITVNGNVGTYPESNAFENNAMAINYPSVYGSDAGEIIFETGNTERENLLIIGESYDNAILKLVATHFNNTYSVDLRNYTVFMNKEFDFSEYITANEIDKVLLIGNVDYIISDDFIVKE